MRASSRGRKTKDDGDSDGIAADNSNHYQDGPCDNGDG